MIDTIIFDIGGVMITFDWFDYLKQLFGDADQEFVQRITDGFWNSGYWTEMDRGVWSEEKVIESLRGVLPDLSDELDIVLDRFGELLKRTDYAIPWIRQLKDKGYKILFLSNYSDFLIRKNPGILDFIRHMDGGVFSHNVKMVKPDKEIYDEICRLYDLDPACCLFTDDTQVKVDGAIAAGLHAIRFDGYDKSYQVIMDYLKENGIG